MVIWVDGAPDVSTPEGAAAAPEFIDRYIRTKVPPVPNETSPSELKRLHQLVTGVQMHSCRSTCQRTRANGETFCRFGFPRPECPATRLKLDTDVGLRRADWYLTERGPGDTCVNAYNPDILVHWAANMDIQFIGAAGSSVTLLRLMHA
jgi:hypothetical protein